MGRIYIVFTIFTVSKISFAVLVIFTEYIDLDFFIATELVVFPFDHKILYRRVQL